MNSEPLFPPASAAEIREKARARREARKAHASSLEASGAKLGDLAGHAWEDATAAFFEVREEQPKLF